MPDLTPSDDELLSSYLDDEVTADERAQVEARLTNDPAFAAQLEALRGASALAGTPVDGLSPGQGTDLIAAALAAAAASPTGDNDTSDENTGNANNVRDFAAASAKRSDRWRGRAVAIAAAAAAVVIAVPLGFLVGMSPLLSKALDPFIQILKPVSPLAWMPLALYTIKDSEPCSIFVILICAIWPVLITPRLESPRFARII